MAAGRDDVDRHIAQSAPRPRPADLADRPLCGRFRRPRARRTRGTSRPCAKTSPTVLEPLGLRLSESKTRIVHMSEGFDFLGFRIQWKRKRGTNKWYVYTFIADRPIRSVKAKIRALTRRTSQQRPRDRADPAQPDHARLGQLLPACRLQTHAQSPAPLRLVPDDPLAAQAAPLEVEGRPPPVHHTHWAVDSRSRRTGSSCSTSAAVPVTRYRYRGNKIPNPWPCTTTPDGSRPWRARCVETRTPGSASGLGKRTESNPGTAPQADSTTRIRIRRSESVDVQTVRLSPVPSAQSVRKL